MFGLHCGVWSVDCAWHQGYKVVVIMAPCEYSSEVRGITASNSVIMAVSGRNGRCIDGEVQGSAERFLWLQAWTGVIPKTWCVVAMIRFPMPTVATLSVGIGG